MLLVSYLIKKAIQKNIPSRQDGHKFLKYLSLEDFSGLKRTKFQFKSKKNTLTGYRYFYNEGSFKGLIVFFHGYGGGHLAYLKEISSLAKEGYLVYAYDNSCCCESEGEGFFSFSQSLIDQKAFFKFLDQDEQAKVLKRFVCGHSWGGFTAVSSLIDDNYKVEKVCGLSPFDNAIDVFISNAPYLKKFKFLLKIFQFRYFGKFGLVSLTKLLKNTSKEVLIVSGDKDKTVDFNDNFLKFKEAAKNKENIHYLISQGRYHQPYNSQRAQDYYLELMEMFRKNEFDENTIVDYQKLIEEDPYIMGQIFEFFNK